MQLIEGIKELPVCPPPGYCQLSIDIGKAGGDKIGQMVHTVRAFGFIDPEIVQMQTEGAIELHLLLYAGPIRERPEEFDLQRQRIAEYFPLCYAGNPSANPVDEVAILKEQVTKLNDRLSALVADHNRSTSEINDLSAKVDMLLKRLTPFSDR